MTTQQNTADISTKEWVEMGYEKANEILAPMPTLDRIKVLKNTPSSMTPYEYWIKKSKAELIQMYMNACVTSSCMGHGKSERNEDAARFYLEIMNQYNLPIPSNDLCYIMGVFNGEGSQ